MANPKDIVNLENLLYEHWGCSLDDYLDALADSEEFEMVVREAANPHQKKDKSVKPKGKK